MYSSFPGIPSQQQSPEVTDHFTAAATATELLSIEQKSNQFIISLFQPRLSWERSWSPIEFRPDEICLAPSSTFPFYQRSSSSVSKSSFWLTIPLLAADLLAMLGVHLYHI